jgi:DNA-binding MarR family transcriptional regulator
VVDEEDVERLPPEPPVYSIEYPFVAFPASLLMEKNDLGMSDFGLLLILAGYARPHKGRLVVWPSIRTIAERCNCSQRSASRAISRLQSLGYIARRRRLGRSSLTELIFIPCPKPVSSYMTPASCRT